MLVGLRAVDNRVRNLPNSPARDIDQYWSPDGTWIVFNSTRAGRLLQLHEVYPDGTGLQRLVTCEDEETCARASPQGDPIVLVANLAAGHDDVILRWRDGSHPVNLTRDLAPGGWPTCTPDARGNVYASGRAGTFALYSMQPGSSGIRQIT